MNATATLDIAPVVSVPVKLEIVTASHDVTMTAAVDRLAAIQELKRALEAEDKALRESVTKALATGGIEKFETPAGHSVCRYDSTNTTWDSEYLKGILTTDQSLAARKVKAFTALRVR